MAPKKIFVIKWNWIVFPSFLNEIIRFFRNKIPPDHDQKLACYDQKWTNLFFFLAHRRWIYWYQQKKCYSSLTYPFVELHENYQVHYLGQFIWTVWLYDMLTSRCVCYCLWFVSRVHCSLQIDPIPDCCVIWLTTQHVIHFTQNMP